jgi:hypothetical protein
MSDVRKGWLCHRVLRWQEPTAALDDSGPHRLQVFDSELGLWLTLAQVQVEEDAMAQGIPVLRGPYVVDFSDIPHDGDALTLWTPQVGDVLLRLFPKWQDSINWDHGLLFVGQNVDGTVTPALNVLAATYTGLTGADGHTSNMGLDIAEGYNATDASGASVATLSFVLPTTDPVQIQLAQTGGTDPTQGHVELYALVARAVAP